MTTPEILLSQLGDPFRLGLLVLVVVLTLGLRVVTDRWPLVLAGAAVVAAILPLFAEAAAPYWQLLLIGLVANAVLLAVVLAIRHVVLRWIA